VIRQVLRSETSEEDTKELVLKLVMSLCDTWPHCLDQGALTGVGPTMLALLPMLAMPKLAHLQSNVSGALEKLIALMLSCPENLAASALLQVRSHLKTVQLSIMMRQQRKL
jgi:hypothetical protein